MSNPVIVRNNQSKELKKEVFGKKSKEHVGKEFFAPELSVPLVREVEIDGTKQNVLVNISDLQWVGLEDMIGMSNTMLRRIFADLYLDNIDEKTGEFNQANWELEAADFSAGVDRLSDIVDELDQLQAEQQKIVEDEHFGEEDASGVKTAEAAALEEQLRALNGRVKPLRVKKAAISAKYQARAAARQARKEKEKTAQGSAPKPEPVAA